ncbi:MAG: EAL domain-containing protein [Rubrobacter sp.]
MRDADTAMYRAKGEGSAYAVFEPAMYEQVIERLQLENDLRRATKDGDFVLHYQPIVDLRTGEMWGVEALVRWNHPGRGLLDPSEFVPAAEESSLIVPMGERVLEDACREALRWEGADPDVPPLVVSVNLSARQLGRPDLADKLEAALIETGLPGNRLCLDVTETVYVKALEGNIAALDRIRRMGVRVSIDDFGTGYSSLSYLKHLPADTLKIDRSFVKGLGEDVQDTAIVRTIIELAHTLGMEVVAEGVEGPSQARLLREMGCDLGQGYHISKPLPPEELPAFLAERVNPSCG